MSKAKARKPRPLEPSDRRRLPPDWQVLALAVLGLLITGYLTYAGWSGGATAFCATGSGCDLVQQSRWSQLLSLPISLWGFGLYALIALTAALAQPRLRRWRWLWSLSLLGVGISLYLTLVALIEIEAACAWCLASLAVLAALLLLLTVRRPVGAPGGRWADWLAGRGLAVGLLLLLLHLNFNELFSPPENPRLRALAMHLNETGARYYGAFWCPNCQEQQRLFGTASRHLPYVECSPNGRSGPVAMACIHAEISGYPTWVFGSRRHVDLLTPEQLARMSGFDWAGFQESPP